MEYHKDSDTWSTGDYTTIQFYNNTNNIIYRIPSNNYSGTSYGNGYFHQTLDFRDNNIIKTYPETYVK